MAVVGIDVGGTFTDTVRLEDGRMYTAKVSTTSQQEEGILAVARAVGATATDRFTHGTTVATNAFLERKGAETALVTTAGFEHVLHLRRQNRADLYDLSVHHAAPLVPLHHCYGVVGRIGPEGVREELDLSSLPEIDADAIAVCLLFAFRDWAHEQAVARELRRRYPDKHVVASHEVAPEFREYERASTTVADAYLGPVVSRYLWSLAEACGAAGLPEPLVMRSSGGLATLEEAAAHPAWILVSGPAGGVVGAAKIAQFAGFENAISFDMGGTSTDVCLIVGGRVERSSERQVGGLPIRLPTVDIHTVGAGGGSLVWRDSGGALRVGPQSAGARPGPAAYGRGGIEATVTDANVVLDRLPGTLADGLRLNRAASVQALGSIDPRAVIDVVNAEMLRALRVVSVQRGHDPGDFALVAFGGAGPLHACGLAEELGCSTVLVPETAGVLSALGLVVSDKRRDHVRSYVQPLREVEELPLEGEAELRYEGQSFELVAVRTADVVPAPRLELHSTHSARVTGPARIDLQGATCWVPDGWAGETDDYGTLRLERCK